MNQHTYSLGNMFIKTSESSLRWLTPCFKKIYSVCYYINNINLQNFLWYAFQLVFCFLQPIMSTEVLIFLAPKLAFDCLLSLEGGIVELTPARPQIKQDTLYHVYGHYHWLSTFQNFLDLKFILSPLFNCHITSNSPNVIL